ncbi:hypothetical protein BDN72DRAFT_85079 [Pluteus cervinus]|uniref:Uncharacterized protein n=1 Tax=Pluteus cervinus TaxID=181527 RepID=A0ACD3AS03_9AGAR|nr:hypothetical protein BDN72DRAFT_85079 [Pluteus cervinus]
MYFTDLLHTLTTAVSQSLFSGSSAADSHNATRSDTSSVSSGSRSPSQSSDVDLSLRSPSTSSSSELSSEPASPIHTLQNLTVDVDLKSNLPQSYYDEPSFPQIANPDPTDLGIYLPNNEQPSQPTSMSDDLSLEKLHDRVSSEPAPSALLSFSIVETASSALTPRGVASAPFVDDPVSAATPRPRFNPKPKSQSRWSTWTSPRRSAPKPRPDPFSMEGAIMLEDRPLRA